MTLKVIFICAAGYGRYVQEVMRKLEANEAQCEIMSPDEAGARIDELRHASAVITVHSMLPSVSAIMAQLAGHVPTLTIQDGIIEHRQSATESRGMLRYRPLLTDMIAVFGGRSSGILAAYGVQESRLHVTGNPRIIWEPPLPPTPDSGVLLVTTANRPAFDRAQMKAFFILFDRILTTCRERGIEFRLRLGSTMRPGGITAVERVAKLVGSGLVSRLRSLPVSDQSLADDLAGSRAVLTTPSTVSLEAMARGMPVGHILPDDGTVYLNPPWSIRPDSDIAAVVNEMLNPPELKMMYQAALLRENLEPGDAAGRIADVIVRLAATGVTR